MTTSLTQGSILSIHMTPTYCPLGDRLVIPTLPSAPGPRCSCSCAAQVQPRAGLLLSSAAHCKLFVCLLLHVESCCTRVRGQRQAPSVKLQARCARPRLPMCHYWSMFGSLAAAKTLHRPPWRWPSYSHSGRDRDSELNRCICEGLYETLLLFRLNGTVMFGITPSEQLPGQNSKIPPTTGTNHHTIVGSSMGFSMENFV